PMLKLTFVVALFALAASTALADVKIKTKNTSGGMSFQTTTLIKGARMRTSQGIGLDNLEQCDLNRTLMINDKGKLYMVQPKPGQDAVTAAQSPDVPQNVMQRPEKSKHEGKHGVTTYTTTIVDTGERKEIFGFTARHLKLSTVAESSSDACNPVKMK